MVRRVAAREDWDEVVGLLRTAASPRSHPAFARLHRLALSDGARALASFRRLDSGLREDVICDLVVAELEALVAADRPRSYFMVAVRRRAIDLLRKLERERPGADEEPGEAAGVDGGQGGDRDFVLEAERELAGLSLRDQRIMSAVGLEEDRDALAVSLGMSRNAIDKVVSRVRERWQEKQRGAEEEA